MAHNSNQLLMSAPSKSQVRKEHQEDARLPWQRSDLFNRINQWLVEDEDNNTMRVDLTRKADEEVDLVSEDDDDDEDEDEEEQETVNGVVIVVIAGRLMTVEGAKAMDTIFTDLGVDSHFDEWTADEARKGFPFLLTLSLHQDGPSPISFLFDSTVVPDGILARDFPGISREDRHFDGSGIETTLDREDIQGILGNNLFSADSPIQVTRIGVYYGAEDTDEFRLESSRTIHFFRHTIQVMISHADERILGRGFELFSPLEHFQAQGPPAKKQCKHAAA